MSTVIDLTERQRDERTTSASKKGSKSSSPAPLAAEAESKNAIRKVPKNYVCKRCSTPGHHITQCPTLHNRQFDSKPGPGYVCHACGMEADHYIHTCPKRIPKSLLKKKQAVLRKQPEEENTYPLPDLRNPDAQVELSSAIQQELISTPKSGSRVRKTSGHVRKRSDDIQFLGERRKRAKPTLGDSHQPVVLDDSPPQQLSKELAVRVRPLTEGRLSPWDTDLDETDAGVEPPPFVIDTVGLKQHSSPDTRRDSRAQHIAELESDSFLAELQKEIEERQVQNILAPLSAFPSLDELFSDCGLPPQQKLNGSTDEGSHASEDLEWDNVPSRLILDDHRDTDMVDQVDQLSSPTPPPASPTIEFYVTPKSLESSAFDVKTLALFENTSNVWIRRNTRPTALDMWTEPHEETRPEAAQTGETSSPFTQEEESLFL